MATTLMMAKTPMMATTLIMANTNDGKTLMVAKH